MHTQVSAHLPTITLVAHSLKHAHIAAYSPHPPSALLFLALPSLDRLTLTLRESLPTHTRAGDLHSFCLLEKAQTSVPQ